VNAAADQQRLMPEATANTWLMTKEHDELLQDEGQKENTEKGKARTQHPTSRARHGLAKARLKEERNNKTRHT
jgi:3-phenylpropionate/cinnamic acid dioxygenase small subunit